jgi:hypothetical protein
MEQLFAVGGPMAADAHAYPLAIQHLDGGLPLTTFAVEEYEIGTRPETQNAAEMLGCLAQEVDTSPFTTPGRHE